MSAQPQGQPAAPNPNQWATDLYRQYQNAPDTNRASLIQQMQGQDMGKAFNEAMKGAGYTLNQEVNSPGNFNYTPPAASPQGSSVKPGAGQPANPSPGRQQLMDLASTSQQTFGSQPQGVKPGMGQPAQQSIQNMGPGNIGGGFTNRWPNPAMSTLHPSAGPTGRGTPK